MIDRLIDARWPLSVLFLAVVLATWQLTAMNEVLPTFILAPVEISSALTDLAVEGDLLPAILISLKRQASGFIIGATLGIVTGLLAGVLKIAEDFFDTLVSLTYPLPKIALFPVIIVWLGFSDTARILVIAMSCFYPTFVNSLAGTRTLNHKMIWIAQNFEANRRRTFRQVIVRGAMPAISVGVRISLALSFILTFATESIGASRDGLGFLIEEGFNNRLFDLMYAGIISFAFLGFLADQIWVRVSARLLRGQRLMAVGRG